MYKSLFIHEMESPECALSCKGCYLKNPMGRPNMTFTQLADAVSPDTELNTALYLNNIPRDPAVHFSKSKLIQHLCVDVDMKLNRRALVTDSITISSMDPEYHISNLECFTEIVVSPRSKSSLETADQLLREYSGLKRLLYTVTVDRIELLKQAIEECSFDHIEVNKAKPVDTASHFLYQTVMHELSKRTDIVLTGDACQKYVSEGRDCHDPEDSHLEVTTFKDSFAFYTCAYPSDKCIAVMH